MLLGAGAAGPAPAEAPGAGGDRWDGAVLASPTAPVLPVKAFLTRGCRAPVPWGAAERAASTEAAGDPSAASWGDFSSQNQASPSLKAFKAGLVGL